MFWLPLYIFAVGGLELPLMMHRVDDPPDYHATHEGGCGDVRMGIDQVGDICEEVH